LPFKQKSLSIKEGAKKELEIEQSQVIMELDACAEKLKALNEEFDRTSIKSPVDGQVIGLQFQTIGSVISPGQRILDVVPQGEPLLIEAKIIPHLIDRVKVNQMADISFTNFAGTPQIVVDGKLVSISNDLLTEPAPSGQVSPSYYLARIAVTEEGMKKLDHHILQSGMPTQVIIKTGERSLIKYLLGPFINRVSTAFTER
jgi:protease secretion system membrane fusion protein